MARIGSAVLEIRQAQPFVKWAGGKSQLVTRLADIVPSDFERYYEPFLGGGALFFHLGPPRAAISDANFELMNTYKVIRGDLPSIVEELERIRKLKLSAALYGKDRNMDPTLMHPAKRAARFIFLNKTCYNGLYRVNSDGKFNVPFGQYERMPSLYDLANLKRINRLLQTTDILCASYEVPLGRAEKNDFVYLDPPYAVDPNSLGFTSYTKDSFSDSDQKQLARKFVELHKRGCYLMLTNSDTQLVHDLYASFRIIPVGVDRMINCVGSRRTGFTDLIILNYDPPVQTLGRWLKT